MQFINPGDMVFDIGANMGNRAKVFLKLGAEVVAKEADDLVNMNGMEQNEFVWARSTT